MFAVIMLIIVIILLLYLMQRYDKTEKKRKNKIEYSDLVGHQNDFITEKILEDLEEKEDKTLEDRYNMFRINLYNRQNVDDARENLYHILDNITEYNPENQDIIFHVFNDVNEFIAPQRLPEEILDNNAHLKRENIDPNHLTERKEIANIYFNETPVHNDPQNVHESEINRFYKNKFDLIKEKNDAEKIVVKDSLPMHIMNIPDPEKRMRAQKTYLSMTSDFPITSLGSSEMKVLDQIWKRIHSEENSGRKKQLIGSLMDQMADATEKSIDNTYHVVCTSGKCLRALDSLTLLDSDETISSPAKTKEIIRKEIFESASKYLEERLEKNDKMYDLYNRPEIDLNEEENRIIGQFVDDIKASFDEKIKEEYKNSGVSKEVIDTVLVEANAGF
jgi:hypothetical protein